METWNKQFWYGLAIASVVSSIHFLGLLFYGYIGDEWSTPPLDERSVPHPKMY